MDEDLSKASKDEIIIVSNHNHPLIKVVDPNMLCDKAMSGQCVSLENKSGQTEPIYFKCPKQNCEYKMCALCTSQYVKKVKKLKNGKTCVIF